MGKYAAKGIGIATGDDADKVAAAWEEYRSNGYDPEIMYRAGVWERPDPEDR